MVKRGLIKKFAFTLIELIFAIVIIGIAVISLPTMIQVSSQGMDNNYAQEAIFAASVEINQALAYFWDENSFDDSNSLARVVSFAGLDCNTTTYRKPGHINQPKHRRCTDSKIALATAPILANFDLKDAVHTSKDNIYDSTTFTAEGYKKNYRSTLTLVTPVLGNQEIKQITATIYSPDDNIITSLNAFSCNIGEVDYHSRTY